MSDLNNQGMKRIFSEDHIQMILHLVRKDNKSEGDLAILKELLKPISSLNNLLKELTEEASLDFFNELRYEHANELQTIISYGDLLKKYYILIKGSAIELTKIMQSENKPSNDNSPLLRKTLVNQTPKKNSLKDNIKPGDSYFSKNNIFSKDNDKSIFSGDSAICVVQPRKSLKISSPENLDRIGQSINPQNEKYYQSSMNGKNSPRMSKSNLNINIDLVLKYFKGMQDSQKPTECYTPISKKKISRNSMLSPKGFLYNPIEETIACLFPQMLITNKFSSGDQFGLEDSIKISSRQNSIYGCSHTNSKTTIVATTPCEIIYIRFSAYKRILGDFSNKQKEERTRILKENPFFQGMPPEAIEEFRKDWHTITYPRNQVIFKEGDPIDFIYLILSGEIEVSLLISQSIKKEELSSRNGIIIEKLSKKGNQFFKRIRIANLVPHQILGDDAFVLTETRNTKATVVSCSAELYPIPINKILSFMSDDDCKQRLELVSLKEKHREKMANEISQLHEIEDGKHIVPKIRQSTKMKDNNINQQRLDSIFQKMNSIVNFIDQEIKISNKEDKILKKNILINSKSENKKYTSKAYRLEHLEKTVANKLLKFKKKPEPEPIEIAQSPSKNLLPNKISSKYFKNPHNILKRRITSPSFITSENPSILRKNTLFEIDSANGKLFPRSIIDNSHERFLHTNFISSVDLSYKEATMKTLNSSGQSIILEKNHSSKPKPSLLTSHNCFSGGLFRKDSKFFKEKILENVNFSHETEGIIKSSLTKGIETINAKKSLNNLLNSQENLRIQRKLSTNEGFYILTSSKTDSQAFDSSHLNTDSSIYKEKNIGNLTRSSIFKGKLSNNISDLS